MTTNKIFYNNYGNLTYRLVGLALSSELFVTGLLLEGSTSSAKNATKVLKKDKNKHNNQQAFAYSLLIITKSKFYVIFDKPKNIFSLIAAKATLLSFHQ